jgi:hypothetical protein
MSLMQCFLCLGSVQSRLVLLLNVDFFFSGYHYIHLVHLTGGFYVICSMSANHLICL